MAETLDRGKLFNPCQPGSSLQAKREGRSRDKIVLLGHAPEITANHTPPPHGPSSCWTHQWMNRVMSTAPPWSNHPPNTPGFERDILDVNHNNNLNIPPHVTIRFKIEAFLFCLLWKPAVRAETMADIFTPHHLLGTFLTSPGRAHKEEERVREPESPVVAGP